MRVPPYTFHFSLSNSPLHYSTMDHITQDIAAMAVGDISVIVNCFQFKYGSEVPRPYVGSRVVAGNMDSIVGMTQDNVYFASCTRCRAVVMCVGIQGSHMEKVLLVPSDPRAILLCQITDLGPNEAWGRPMGGPARVVGMINVHGVTTMSVGTCFHCGF